MKKVTALVRSAVEPGSVKTYSSGLHKFEAFVKETCRNLDRPIWPHATPRELRDLISTPGVIEAFIVFAHEDGMVADSIKVYISALKYHATDGYGQPTLPNKTVMNRLLEGCAKEQGPPSDGKLGIGIIRLGMMFAHFETEYHLKRYEATLWRAMIASAFFAAFRVSEYLISDDDTKKLTMERVFRRSDGWIRFDLHKTKNNPRGRVQPVLFPRLQDEIACPATAIEAYLQVRPKTDPTTPFFVDRTGKAMTYVRYNEGLIRLMAKIEPDLKGRFTTKSFRIGATSDAYALNIERNDISNLGRWALGSTAYMSYVNGLSRAERAVHVQKRISEGHASHND